jgi:AraC-like DNA-binding protein
MIGIARQASGGLARFVESIWLYDGYQPGHLEELHLPDAGSQLVIDLRSEQPSASIVGPSSKPFFIDTACQFSVIGVQFRPGCIPTVVGLSGRDILNESIALGVAWGKRAHELQERLREAGSDATRLDTLNSFLSAELRDDFAPSPTIAFAVRRLERHPGDRVIRQLVGQSDMTRYRFIQQFEDAVGLKPKLFQRLQRFRRSVRMLHQCPEESLASVAFQAGYYDQAHFTHDFVTFASMPPSAYRERRGEHATHIPLHDQQV